MIDQIFSDVISHVNLTDDMTILEFGVASGNCLIATLKQFKLRNKLPKQVIGFDSFEGLPSEMEDIPCQKDWHKGAFELLYEISNNKQLVGIPNKPTNKEDGIKLVQNRFAEYGDLVKFVVGFYENTLTKELVNTLTIKPASFIHIDCDLYLSTKQALGWIFDNELAAEGCIFRYDDWVMDGIPEGCGGESKAHYEITSKYDLLFETIKIGPHAAIFKYKGKRSD